MSIGPDASFVAEDEADGNGSATVGVDFLSPFLPDTDLTGLAVGGLAAGGLAAGGLAAGGFDVVLAGGFYVVLAAGATGCDVGAAAGWTIFTMFSSR